MKWEHTRKQLLGILDSVPGIKKIVLSDDKINEKRKKILSEINSYQDKLFKTNPDLPSLEWVLSRDSGWVLRSMFLQRNEIKAGFSALEYVVAVAKGETEKSVPFVSDGFLKELEHLFKGLSGTSSLYKQRDLMFEKKRGRKAAKLRSRHLSDIAGYAQERMDSYISGLDRDAISRRQRNRKRILNYFDSESESWYDWRWQTRHIIRDADTLNDLIKLTDEEYRAVKLAGEYKVPFGITPYYLSLMEYHHGSGLDRAVRAQVIPSVHYVKKHNEMKKDGLESMDFMQEIDTSPIEGITRRYPMIVILKPVMTCPQICVYCQRNWEIEDVYSKNALLPENKLDEAIKWIEDTKEIREVLVTGGDPFILSNRRIEYILKGLSKIDHINRIRIGTRTPVTLPFRIDESLMDTVSKFHVPGRREILIVTHFEHPYEITPESMKAVQRIRDRHLDVKNQLVYTFYNSRRFEACALRDKLRLIGVVPYYTFNTKGKEETNDFRVPIARILQEQKEEARLLPGTLRTDEAVYNVPRLGKNYIRSYQNHELISILPDGRRVYEFHPWEKKIDIADTYVNIDVSINDYLKRLKKAGEDISKYQTIWYYY